MDNEPVSEAEDTPTMPRNLPPISSLSADILLEIFRFNANMDEDSPLKKKTFRTRRDMYRAMNAIRISSQVSSVWRNIIINAPLLWANLIDIDLMHRAQHQWREAVIGRAQTSPLHIKGSISLTDLDDSDPWWLHFLNSSWPRIRKLDFAVITDVNDRYSLNDAKLSKYRKGLSFLSQPTPSLQFFRIKLQNQCNPLENGRTLFDNHAPQLRHFESENMQFAIGSTWLLPLRSLHISKHDREIFSSVDVLCQVLCQMEHLESLALDDFTINRYIAPNRVPIHLPSLKYFRFQTPFDPDRSVDNSNDLSNSLGCWPLLNYITLDPGCSVRVSISNLLPFHDVDTSILSRLAKDYFQVNNATHLTLSTRHDLFKLTDSKRFFDSSLDKSISVSPFFTLWFRFHYDMSLPPSDMRIYQLFKELFVLSFPAVVELDLRVSDGHLICFTDPQFGQFLSSFTALKKLVTDPYTLQHLYTSQIIVISSLFPLLDVLEIFTNGIIPLLDIVAPFFQLRKEVDVPVSTFSYRYVPLNVFAISDDLTPLDDIKGLKIVWEVTALGCGEYICGSGTPEVLKFSGMAGERSRSEMQRQRDMRGT